MENFMKIEYTPIDEVAETLLKRRSNKKLQAKFREFVGGVPLSGCFEKDYLIPPAVYAEYIARPTVADIEFAKQATEARLEPWWATYLSDTFTTTNPKKTDMFRPPLALPKGQSTRSWVVNQKDRNVQESLNTRGIGEFPTIYPDLTITQYWQKLREQVLPKYGFTSIGNVVDMSDVYAEWQGDDPDTKKGSEKYYPKLMGLYACRAALFVDYDRFPSFKPIAEAGYEAATNTLGVEPIIVKYNPENIKYQALGQVLDQELDQELGGSKRILDYRQTDLTWMSDEQVKRLNKNGMIV